MDSSFFRNSWLLALLFVSVVLITRKSHGETIVIGGGPGALPWDEQYSDLSVIDFDTNPGTILPRQTDPNDNLSLGLIARGGAVTSPNADKTLGVTNDFVNKRLATMVSGDTLAFEVSDISSAGIIIFIDLGETFGVNRIKFFPRSDHEQFFLRGYEISVNDGSKEQTSQQGNPVFRHWWSTSNNTDPVVDLHVPLQNVRFIRLQQIVSSEWEIDEFQVFGEGYVRSAAYTSRILDSFDMLNQGQLSIFGGIEWSKGSIGQPDKSSATVTARSGNGTSSSDVVWSDWSPPYPAGALTDILLPAPRRFFQFHILFESNDLESAATVDSLAFQVSPAVADSIKGEIWPQTTRVAQDTRFAYTIRSFNSTGFDTLEIKTLAPVDVVSSVQIDGIEVDDIDKTDVKDGFKIAFPRITGDKTLRVMFNSLALQYNTIFSGKVWDSQRPDWFPQSVVDGDVASDFGIFLDGLGNIYIADTFNHRIRKVDTSGIINTVAGNGIAGFSGDGGPATSASLNVPSGVFVDGLGNIYIADTFNHRIRKVDMSGIINTVAGNGIRGFSGDDSLATSASLDFPEGVFVDGLGNISIPDQRNQRIRIVDTSGIISTVARTLPAGDDLSVELKIDKELDVIYSIKTEPNPFTPNGDGINDILFVTYDIVNLTDIVPVSVSVYDLSGRLRKEIYSGQDSSGRYPRDWDGTDDGGELLPPGTYLLRVELKTDSGTLGKTETVSVVY